MQNKTKNTLIISTAVLVLVVLVGFLVFYLAYDPYDGVRVGMDSRDMYRQRFKDAPSDDAHFSEWFNALSFNDRLNIHYYALWENKLGDVVIAQTTRNDPYVVTDLHLCSRFGFSRSDKTFELLEKDMDIYEVISKIGIPDDVIYGAVSRYCYRTTSDKVYCLAFYSRLEGDVWVPYLSGIQEATEDLRSLTDL